MLISWRLLRADPWPAWWAAPLGLVNDLFTGYPIGFSIALWSATMLALDLIDRRTMWRDYWIEWVLAAVLIAIDEWLQWRVAALAGAALPFARMVPPLIISICVFPLRLARLADRRVEARPMKHDPDHQRAPVDHLFAADDAARRRAGGGRRRC